MFLALVFFAREREREGGGGKREGGERERGLGQNKYKSFNVTVLDKDRWTC